jgi:hypothetical protein
MNFLLKSDNGNLVSYANHIRLNPSKYEDRSVNNVSQLILSFMKQNFPRFHRDEITGLFRDRRTMVNDTGKYYRKFKAAHPELVNINRYNFHVLLSNLYELNSNALKQFFNRHGLPRGESNILKLIPSLNIKRVDGISNDFRYEEVKNIFIGWFDLMMGSIFNSTPNSNLLVLIGPENCKKVDFFVGMVPERIRSFVGLTDPFLSASQLCEKFLLVTEFGKLNEYKMKSFQSFISKTSYSYVSASGSVGSNRTRLASLCATAQTTQLKLNTNKMQVCPVEITSIDWSLFQTIDKEALFLEAYSRYLSPKSKISTL